MPKFGLRRARFWYWSQTFRSIGPIIIGRLAKLAKLGTGAAVVDYVRRKIGW